MASGHKRVASGCLRARAAHRAEACWRPRSRAREYSPSSRPNWRMWGSRHPTSTESGLPLSANAREQRGKDRRRQRQGLSKHAGTSLGGIVKMTRRVRIAILSESRLFREAVSSCLATEPEVELVGQANTVHDLLLRAQGRAIDVLLVYPGTRPVRPLEALWDVKTLLPASRVALLGCEHDHPEIARWNEVDNVAWLDQDTSYQSVLEAIEALSEGRAYAGGQQPKVGTERSWAPTAAWSRAAQDPVSARLRFIRSATRFPAIRGRGTA